MTQADPLAVAVYVVGAVVYSLVTYFAKRTKPEGETFDPKKFTRAVVVGFIVGLFAYVQGAELSLANFDQLVQASGATMIADQVVKAFWRYVTRLSDSTTA